MLFIALAKFKTTLSKEVVARNMKDIGADTKGQVRSWTYTGLRGGTIPLLSLKPRTKKH